VRASTTRQCHFWRFPHSWIWIWAAGITLAVAVPAPFALALSSAGYPRHFRCGSGVGACCSLSRPVRPRLCCTRRNHLHAAHSRNANSQYSRSAPPCGNSHHGRGTRLRVRYRTGGWGGHNAFQHSYMDSSRKWESESGLMAEGLNQPFSDTRNWPLAIGGFGCRAAG
jgi:hypothetical protein